MVSIVYELIALVLKEHGSDLNTNARVLFVNDA